MASKETEYRFLLAGKSGCGKSSTGNTIMGENVFPTSFGFSSGTKLPDYRKSTKPKKGQTFRILDTTGFFDPKMPNDKIAEQIVQASACLEPGFHALLYVLQIDRFTPEEQQTFMRLKELFDPNIVNYTIIIVTRGDELKKRKITLEQLLEQADEPLRAVMRECGNRVVVFNNEDKSKRDKQVKELLAEVHKVQSNNNNVPYRSQFQEVVNTRLQERNTMRVKEKIRRDPKLRELFEGMEVQAKEARESADRHHQEAKETLKQATMIEEKLEEEERRQKEEARKKMEREKKEQEVREEQARKHKEDEERKEREEEQRQKEEEERNKRLEEERQRKEKEAEEKKKMEEMQKQLQQLKTEREIHEKVEAEKRKLEQEMKEKLRAATEKQEKEEMENTKKDIAEGKESHWAVDVVGGLWKGAKGYLGF